MLNDTSRRTLHVSVTSRVLHHALLHVAEAAGWVATVHRAPGIVVVTDRALTDADVDVLIVEPSPIGCRHGLEAVTDGRAKAVLCADEPDALPDALDALAQDWCVMPARLVQIACELPVMTPRQRDIAQAIVAGQPNRAIARGLRVSEATVKREVGLLLRAFDATDRLNLVSQLVPFGLQPQRLSG